MGKKAKELPRMLDLGTKAPKARKDELPHWMVWRFATANPGTPWAR